MNNWVALEIGGRNAGKRWGCSGRVWKREEDEGRNGSWFSVRTSMADLYFEFLMLMHELIEADFDSVGIWNWKTLDITTDKT